MRVTVIQPSSRPVLPPLIAGAGKPAARRFLEFFTVNARDCNTRATSAWGKLRELGFEVTIRVN